MSLYKASGLAIFAVLGLLGKATDSAYARCSPCAVQWSGGRIINLAGLPGATGSSADSINGVGQTVGYSEVGGVGYAAEWSGGSVINLGGLPGFTNSAAASINDAGQAVGSSYVHGVNYATEWSGGSVIELVGLPGSTDSSALGINDAGQVVGESEVGGVAYATEWSGSSVINLGSLPGNLYSAAYGINDAGQAVGYSFGAVPESSTCAMMLFGFAGFFRSWPSSRESQGLRGDRLRCRRAAERTTSRPTSQWEDSAI